MRFYHKTRKTSAIWPMLLLALLSARPLSAAAQSSVHSLAPVGLDSARQAAREDTAYALQRLFHENRRRYRLQAAVRGAGLGLTSAYTVLVTLRQPDQTMQKVTSVSVGAVLLGVFTYSVVKLYSYRAHREKKLLTALKAGVPLPYSVRKELKPGYFDTQLSSQ